MDDMLDTMYDANGTGLAAIQVGVVYRVIVMDISRREQWHGATEDDPEGRYGRNARAISSIPKLSGRRKKSAIIRRAACLYPVFTMMSRVQPNAALPFLIMTARRRNWRATACWPPAFNTRWIIWKALFSRPPIAAETPNGFEKIAKAERDTARAE